MFFKRLENAFAVRLEKGEEIAATLKRFCAEQKITLGSVSGIGAVRTLTLGFFNPSDRKYREETFEDFFEITSLSGNITTKEGLPYLHLHMNAAGNGFRTIGGHLIAATISLTGEIFIRTWDARVGRVMDEELGINLMQMD